MIIVVVLLYPGLRLALSETRSENSADCLSKMRLYLRSIKTAVIGCGAEALKLTFDWLKDVRFPLPCTLWKYAAGYKGLRFHVRPSRSLSLSVAEDTNTGDIQRSAFTIDP